MPPAIDSQLRVRLAVVSLMEVMAIFVALLLGMIVAVVSLLSVMVAVASLIVGVIVIVISLLGVLMTQVLKRVGEGGVIGRRS